ncbi:hypothetical protein Vadar_007641 [Vaccinium darrowii]|uniref:Uncharacterized protein n=1 Tax=Vaccinium darrowii TaxID=229202 RepID=A0ACB7XXW3_9ERIC|nr:hypothetical protein Vadar_007641 [Vaccinium darrowii]
MGTPHVLAIPYPAQGHVIPLLELAQRVAQHGFKVTFVNSEFNHRRVMNALLDKDNVGNHVNLVSIPDGLEQWEDRNDLQKLTESTLKIMPGKLEELIEKINGSDNKKITCVIADGSQGWALEVAKKMRIRRAAFWPAAATIWALGFNIPELIADGIIDTQSVIYVAFGSFIVFDQIQFQELATGLELTNWPFLWVVRPDITEEANDAYPRGFKERVATRRQMNSTIEGVTNGIPFLCWPYFPDPSLNQSYICNVWKIGLGFNRGESGIIRQDEIKGKVEQLLANEALKARALHLKEVTAEAVKEGGCSGNNFNNFIKWVKE